MCGRFTLFADEEDFKEEFSLEETFHFPPHYNIAPNQDIPIIVYNQRSGTPEVQLASWGFIPTWAKDLKKTPRPINARYETLQEKPYFKKAFAHQRCLIPANGYYEWDKNHEPSIPYRFCFKDNHLFAFAGLWSQWVSPDNSNILSCIITVEANSLVGKVHTRMPVVLLKNEYERWLSFDTDLKSLSHLLQT